MNIKDIITLNDNHKYQIISKTIYNETVYYYLVDIEDITNIKILYENFDYLTEVADQDLINLLLPKFFLEIKDLL